MFSYDKSKLSSGTNATLLPLSICVMSLSVDDTARAVKSNNSGCDRVLDGQSPQSESESRLSGPFVHFLMVDGYAKADFTGCSGSLSHSSAVLRVYFDLNWWSRLDWFWATGGLLRELFFWTSVRFSTETGLEAVAACGSGLQEGWLFFLGTSLGDLLGVLMVKDFWVLTLLENENRV